MKPLTKIIIGIILTVLLVLVLRVYKEEKIVEIPYCTTFCQDLNLNYDGGYSDICLGEDIYKDEVQLDSCCCFYEIK